MTHLSLAEVDKAVALQDGNRFTIYVEGYTSGYGGQLRVWHRKTKEHPPLFLVFAIPGNSGINPSESPEHVLTKSATYFEGAFPHIQLHTASGRIHVDSVSVENGIENMPKVFMDPTSFEDEQLLGWTAIHNFQPMGKPHLSVCGVMMMPTPGYKLSLTKAKPQGINPSILLLTLKTEPPGLVSKGITKTAVTYEEDTDIHYKMIQIEPAHILVPVNKVV